MEYSDEEGGFKKDFQISNLHIWKRGKIRNIKQIQSMKKKNLRKEGYKFSLGTVILHMLCGIQLRDVWYLGTKSILQMHIWHSLAQMEIKCNDLGMTYLV